MSDPDELRSLLFLRLLPGVGDRRATRALERFGSGRAVVELPTDEFSAHLGRSAARARSGGAGWRTVDAIFARCRGEGIRVVGRGGAGYPSCLFALADPPPVLFMRGNPALLERRAVAIVGSRRATATGRRTAERLARDVSDAGVAVVSGMALGIDGAAHRGALQGPGSTIAVLGSGPDRAYPSGNRGLFASILDRGLVVSEFPPGEEARPYHFPRRNRVLAALSRAVVVVQAARRSGALITVEHALDLGLEVFAVPGSVERRQAEGANALLRDGAHVLTDGRDLLEVMGWAAVPGSGGDAEDPTLFDAETSRLDIGDPGAGARAGGEDEGRGRSTVEPGSDRSRVRSVLQSSPRPVDSIVTELGFPAQRVLAALTRLELEGSACREGGGWTRRRRR